MVPESALVSGEEPRFTSEPAARGKGTEPGSAKPPRLTQKKGQAVPARSPSAGDSPFIQDQLNPGAREPLLGFLLELQSGRARGRTT